MFCTSKDNNVVAMESQNAPMSYLSINYNTRLHRSIVSLAASIKSLDESDVPIDKCERPFANAFGVLPFITFAGDLGTLFSQFLQGHHLFIRKVCVLAASTN
jgi:hypothetical protein